MVLIGILANMVYLYIIANRVNNKVYIGQAIDPNRRWKKHITDARRDCNQRIHKAMMKYGIENFSFEVIAQTKIQENADFLEAELINRYRSRERSKGYNVAPGGIHGGPGFGHRQSEETKAKIRISLLGRKHSYERRRNQSLAHKGKPLSQAQREALASYWASGRCGEKTRFRPGNRRAIKTQR